MELPDPVVERLLDTWPVARFATLGPDGRPHQVPIVFARRAGTLYSAADGKPKRAGELARIRNARARPPVSLLLDDYFDDWQQLWWLRIEGDARVLDSGNDELARALAALRIKYTQYEEVALGEVALAIDIRRLSSWCASPAALPR